MRGADALVRMLINDGVDVLFGVPADTNAPFYETLQRRTGDTGHLVARDGRSTGSMAGACARLADSPGVFECPSGAGAMYAWSPVARSNAQTDRMTS